jgi:hypothetical protein
MFSLTALRQKITASRSWRSFSVNLTSKYRNLAKKFRYFSGFSLLCNKISFWELKEVLFALFPPE